MHNIPQLPREVAEPLVTELKAIFHTGDGALSQSQKVAHLKGIRERFPGFTPFVDEYLVYYLEGLQKAFKKLEADQDELRGMLEKIGGEPWHPAVYLGPVATRRGDMAMVLHGTERRVVALGDSVARADLAPGDEVLLNCELNVVMERSPDRPAGGETAVFRGMLKDGRILLACGDTEMVACAAGKLLEELAKLKEGDALRWMRNAWLALEKLDPVPGEHPSLLEEVSEIGADQIGGQHENLNRLLCALMLILVYPERAAVYGAGGKTSILLVGPPGTGKTLMARIAASMLAQRSGKKCRFAVVKPSEWEDPYVGVTQRNIRNFFKSMRESAQDGYVVVFFDEVESIGRIRGGQGGLHSDKFVASFLAELQGFEERRNIVVIAATNRKDLLDPAVLQRLSDMELEVSRPDRSAAREILGIHLAERYPYSPNGAESARTRDAAIETALSMLFSPNADNKVALIRFSDGKTRTIAARELISGRILEQIARQARQRALERDVATNESGICVDDVRFATEQALARMRSTLTRQNAHAYLADLPQDLGVVSVQAERPASDRSTRPLRTE